MNSDEARQPRCPETQRQNLRQVPTGEVLLGEKRQVESELLFQLRVLEGGDGVVGNRDAGSGGLQNDTLESFDRTDREIGPRKVRIGGTWVGSRVRRVAQKNLSSGRQRSVQEETNLPCVGNETWVRTPPEHQRAGRDVVHRPGGSFWLSPRSRYGPIRLVRQANRLSTEVYIVGLLFEPVGCDRSSDDVRFRQGKRVEEGDRFGGLVSRCA